LQAGEVTDNETRVGVHFRAKPTTIGSLEVETPRPSLKLFSNSMTAYYILEGRHLRKEITGAVKLNKEYIIEL